MIGSSTWRCRTTCFPLAFLQIQRASVLLWGFLLLFTGREAQAWRSSLYPLNWTAPGLTDSFETNKLIQDFSYAGYHAGEAALPSVAGPILNVTQAPYYADATGATDATTAIQSAINAATSAGGGVVFLPSGLYRVSVQGSASYALRVNGSKVVLRGAGTNQTHILNTSTNMRSKSVILMEGPTAAGFFSSGAGSTLITQDLAGPATSIPVASTTGFAVGQYVVVRADATDAWITEHKEPGWIGYGSSLRGTTYFRRVTAVDAANSRITIDSPTRYYLKTRDNARVVRLSGNPITECGLEGLSLANVQLPGTGWAEEAYNYSTNASYYAHDSFLVRTRDCWIQGVNSYRPSENSYTCHLLSNGILLSESTRVTLRDVHLQRPQYGGGGGNGYMYRLANAGDCLAEQCRSTFSRHGMVLSSMASSGNVFHRCIDKDTGRQTGDTGSQSTGGSNCDHHMHFSHSNLIDASTGDNSAWEARYRPYGSVPLHNLTSAHGVYWNMQGIGSGASYIVRTEQSRYGYAIGTRGTRTGVDRPTFGGTKCDPLDHVEGIAQGDTLEPFSLYEDQLIRRLNLPGVNLPAVVVLPFPSNSITLSATVLAGGLPAAPGTFTAAWSALNPPGAVTFSSTTVTNPLVTFSVRSNHALRLVATVGGRQATGEVTVVLAPAAFSARESVETIADAYTRDGVYAVTNYGLDTTIQIKASTVGFNRRSLMRFSLGTVALTNFNRAYVELRPTATPAAGTLPTLELWHMTNDAWGETSVTWNTQPALASLARAWLMTTNGVERADVTAVARQEMLGDKALSLALQVGSQPGVEVFAFHSRQSASLLPPLLVIEKTNAPVSFNAWIGSFPGISAGLRAPQADSDGDGLSQAEEYYFGTDPSVPESTRPLAVEKTAGGLVIHFPLSKNLGPTAGLAFERTMMLVPANWQLVPGVAYETVGEAGATVLMKAFLPDPAAGGAAYYRLRLAL